MITYICYKGKLWQKLGPGRGREAEVGGVLPENVHNYVNEVRAGNWVAAAVVILDNTVFSITEITDNPLFPVPRYESVYEYLCAEYGVERFY